MTLTAGKRTLYGISALIYFTDTEKEEVESFMKQFGGQFIITNKEKSECSK